MDWIPISPENAQSWYGIPADIANNNNNKFFGTPLNLPSGRDISRPLLAFLQNKISPNVFTFHVQTIEPETWEHHGMLPNPLEMQGGIINIDKSGLSSLFHILSKFQNLLTRNKSTPRPVFRKVEDSELVKLRLHPEWFPNMELEHYIQVYDPLSESDKDDFITILVLSIGDGISRVGIKITQFSLLALQDERFEPLYNGHSKINLNRDGFQELREIIKAQINRVKSQKTN